MPIFSSDDFHIEQAAERLRAGELVAFPTETVYGLGAHALDAAAVAKIYAIKGRPAYNPLIVHVPDVAGAKALASAWNERAQRLADAFWPGPLTLVLPKSSAIPSNVSAGLETVALRVPAQEIAQKLLRQAQIPLAAPSANASGQISPTLAHHVTQSLGEAIWVLDGGPCEVGIESTVVDVSGPFASILRAGSIDSKQIEAIIGALVAVSVEDDEAPRPSPGMLARHYAPRARVQLFSTLTNAHFHAVLLGANQRIGVLCFAPTRLEAALEIVMPLDATHYARELYANLRAFDAQDVSLILVEEVPAYPEWQGVQDRLQRAAASEFLSGSSSTPA